MNLFPHIDHKVAAARSKRLLCNKSSLMLTWFLSLIFSQMIAWTTMHLDNLDTFYKLCKKIVTVKKKTC